jgi:hypothetical protein
MDMDIMITVMEDLTRMENDAFTIHLNNMHSKYSAMHENSLEIIQEGFGDFINSCVNFFKALIKKIGVFFDKVMMFVRAYIGDFDKFLTKYKSELIKKTPDFTIQGYDYTFKPGIPDMSIVEHIISGYNSELRELSTNTTKGYVVELRAKYASDEFFDTVRGKCMGKSAKVSSANFASDLKKEFRSGESDTKEVKVNATVLRGCIEDYPKLKTSLTDLTKTKGNITSLMTSLMSFFQEGTHVYFKENDKVIGADQLKRNDYSVDAVDRTTEKFSPERLTIYNSFYDYKFKQARELSQIAIISITSKIDALKEALKMYRTIVRQSM